MNGTGKFELSDFFWDHSRFVTYKCPYSMMEMPELGKRAILNAIEALNTLTREQREAVLFYGKSEKIKGRAEGYGKGVTSENNAVY